MASLHINGTDYEAKCTFAFEKHAEKNYDKEDENGNKAGGFSALYMQLLQGTSNMDLVAFWDCGLAHIGQKGKPSLADIEAALEARIEEDGDSEALYKEAFGAIDEAGFFKKQAKNFWKNFEYLKESGKDDDEKAKNLKVYQRMIESRDELRA